MHDDRELLERRIARETWDRVLPLVHRRRSPLRVEAGPGPDDLAPFDVGTAWGAPWQTTWFRLTGRVPDDWTDRDCRIEAVIDLGFTRSPAGFQAEGLVVERRPNGSLLPVQGIHPRRTNLRLDGRPGESVDLLVEAASNPTFPHFRPSCEGLVETASKEPIYTFRTADLVLLDEVAEAFSHDLDVLDGRMRNLPPESRERARILTSLVEALDAVPDVEAAGRAVEHHLAGRRPLDESASPHRIVATGHAHIDTAWLWPIRETIRKCTRTFASATALMDDDPDYVFSCSQAQHYAWMEEHQPELFARICERVERGQWNPVGGMWVEADMNLPSGESLARQIVFGQRYFIDRFGAPSTEVWIPDVFGYPAGLPQLFAAGGMRRFVTQKLSWNKQNRFPHHTFWWEGLDGTRVLTHFPPVDTYNAEITPAEIRHSIDRFKEHRWSSVSLMPFGHGDGGGGPTREMLARAHRQADLDPEVSLELGRPSTFFDAVEREAVNGAPIPVWRGELYFEMHRGTLTSQLRTKLGNRRCERLLVEAELWAATLGRSADVDDLWREVLTQQFHDILPGSSIAWVHRDAEDVFDRVGGELDARIAAMLAELSDGRPVLANRADASFDGVVLVPGVAIDGGLATTGDGQSMSDGSVAVRVSAPALSIADIVPATVDDRVVVTGSSMTNGHLAVRWNAHGDITSVIDLAQRRELIPEGSLAASLEIARDEPVEYDAWDLESWTRSGGTHVGRGEVTVDASGPLVGVVTVRRSFGPSTADVTYELHAGARQLLVHVDIDWHHDEHLLSMAFPLDVRADQAACDVQFGVTMRPTHASSSWDAAKFEVCAHRYVSVSEPTFGAAVLNDGRYGHSVFDGAIRVSLARAAKYPDPDADHGRHRVTLALLVHDGDLVAVRDAASLIDQPPRVVAPSPPAAGGNALPSPSANGPSRASSATPVVAIVSDRPGAPGVQVGAVKFADDGSGDLVVRLHEAVGDRRRISLRCRSRVERAQRCDLLEQPVSAEEVGDGHVSLTLRPFELVTLRLSLTDLADGR